VWDEEVLRECGGDWLFVHYADFHRFLFECAEANGTIIRLGSQVVGLDEDEDATVILANGERVRGDVIIGADGAGGALRKTMLDREEYVQGNGLMMYKFVLFFLARKSLH
jgi:salicylate hydroxylase